MFKNGFYNRPSTLLASLALLFFVVLAATPPSSLAVSFLLPQDEDIVGNITWVKAQKGDTLIKIGKRFNIGRHEMLRANPGIKAHRLKIGQMIIVPQLFIMPPTEYREGILINIPELRLYHFSIDSSNSTHVSTFPVALGRPNWRTPTTKTAIRGKKEKPSWHVPTSIREYTYNKKGIWLPDVVGPGPKNPLGNYAVYLEKRGYLIHGTNNPSSIGTLASSGCIRMYNADIEALFQFVIPGDPVTIIHHVYKAGWRRNTLYLEAHPAVSHNERITSLNHTSVDDVIMQATLYNRHPSIDWKAVKQVVKEKTGIPQPIGHR